MWWIVNEQLRNIANVSSFRIVIHQLHPSFIAKTTHWSHCKIAKCMNSQVYLAGFYTKWIHYFDKQIYSFAIVMANSWFLVSCHKLLHVRWQFVYNVKENLYCLSNKINRVNNNRHIHNHFFSLDKFLSRKTSYFYFL